ncbi:MAG TPA: UPF0182 family protein, partial [Blastocatellia bacterium]|nr:UPF0182 family protein [Blastocatellia bacterium]
AKESAFIQHNIEMTRKAFAIERFKERPPFNPTANLTPEQLEANRDMLHNIRLWDRVVLQRTLKQYQEIRSYYEFDVPDVDRYRIDGSPRQVILAAREMEVEKLPAQSNNWINRHVVYTHGYGVTMSTVNEVTPEGLPNLLLKNMPVESQVPEIKVTRPEIYFGEANATHVYVHTRPQGSTQPEFNFPASSNEDAYSEYEGTDGIPVGGLLRKIALALYLGDGLSLLNSNYINSDSRVLIRRRVPERIQEIAPFLMVEPDPYIVINREGRLVWMVDAYTFSDRYPLSRMYSVQNRNLNYVRNSVKVVVDAYNGDVRFYVFEPDDPLIKTYQNIFPGLFHKADEMPADLREHVRYPSLLTSLQATVFALYHMRNPQSFYNHEDVWAVPLADSRIENQEEPPPMQPYHVLMRLPGEDSKLEFVNVLPFKPAGQDRNNMIGWMATRSDGENYGTTLVYTFPKNITIAGPAQIRARASQDSQLSQKMALWNTQGSRLTRGSLLPIPIADSLLYIEPFYIEASKDGVPELRQVVVSNQDRLAAADTFDDALKALFPGLLGKQRAEPAQSSLPSQPAQQQSPSVQQPRAGGSDIDQLSRDARQLLLDYERLTAEGKHKEAGEKLDRLKQTLDQLVLKRGNSQ